MNKKLDKIFFLVGCLMILSEIWKQYCLTFIINDGSYDWWYFPFQLCSIPMYLLMCLPLLHKTRTRSLIYTFLMDYVLLCGVFVFFDTSGMFYDYLPLTIHSFVWHFLLIGLGIAAGFSDHADYSYRGFLKSSLIYVCGCIIAAGLNYLLHDYGKINMFYISPYYYIAQPVFRTIRDLFGNQAAILCYIAAVFSGALFLHVIWRFVYRKSPFSK